MISSVGGEIKNKRSKSWNKWHHQKWCWDTTTQTCQLSCGWMRVLLDSGQSCSNKEDLWHMPLAPWLTVSAITHHWNWNAWRSCSPQRSLTSMSSDTQMSPGTEQVIADMLSRSLSKDGGKGTLAREHVFQMEAQEEILRRFNIPDPTSDKYVSDARYQAIRWDMPTDQTLKRVAEIITAGWPRSVDQLPQLVRPYWTWRDELTILDGIMYKGTRIICSEDG